MRFNHVARHSFGMLCLVSLACCPMHSDTSSSIGKDRGPFLHATGPGDPNGHWGCPSAVVFDGPLKDHQDMLRYEISGIRPGDLFEGKRVFDQGLPIGLVAVHVVKLGHRLPEGQGDVLAYTQTGSNHAFMVSQEVAATGTIRTVISNLVRSFGKPTRLIRSPGSRCDGYGYGDYTMIYTDQDSERDLSRARTASFCMARWHCAVDHADPCMNAGKLPSARFMIVNISVRHAIDENASVTKVTTSIFDPDVAKKQGYPFPRDSDSQCVPNPSNPLLN